MNSFLTQVARHYIDTPNLHNYTFVFPNRRSGKFFERALRIQAKQPVMLPRIMAANEWIAELMGIVPVDDLEALMILYQAYTQVMDESAQGFDHFVFWAHLITSDFDEADKALADIDLLYGNLSDLRQLSTDYLSPELKRHLGEVLNIGLPLTDGSDRFWLRDRRKPADSNDADSNQEVKQLYLDLWKRLADIYHTYFSLLEQRRLSTYAHAYRQAALDLSSGKSVDLHTDRVVMVGFGQLTVSELAIFTSLRRNDQADFWWDNASPIFADKGGSNPASDFVARYATLFPSPVDIEPCSFDNHQVNIVAVPSNTGQAKWAFQYIDTLIERQIIAPENAINTAIVLPDEALFVPLINAISPKIGKINVTMGYPLRASSIASLMRLVVKAHRQSSHNRTTDCWSYYHEDIRDILSHPLVKTSFTTDALKIVNIIDWNHLYNVEQTRFENTVFEPLFSPVDDPNDKEQVLRFIGRLVEFCQQIDEQVKQQHQLSDTILPLQSAFIEQYIEALQQVQAALDRNGLPATDDTIFFLIDRLLQHYVMPFEGEPLEGLQIMGLLETRSLDFDHLIILSANERVFPSRHPIHSFISDELRAAFNLPTAEQADSSTAYYFYRMIARAQSVTLVYNSAEAQNEQSRFITQLQLLYGNQLKINSIQVATSDTSVQPPQITVAKDNINIHDYVNPAADVDPENAHCLSASSINQYINCPLQFYFHHVEHLSDNNPATDFIDPASLGSIIHDTLQDIYYPDLPDGRRRKGPNVVTRQSLEHFLKKNLRAAVERRINLTYLHRPEGTPISGELLILEETIETLVSRAIYFDFKQMAYHGVDQIEVLEGEGEHMIPLRFGDVTFNFSYKPDRVDRINGILRIIDYKTGKDETSFGSLDDLFDSSKDNRRKAILQLMLYCNAWVAEYGETPIQPMIYRLLKPDESGVKFGKGKSQITFDSTGDLNRQFVARMADVVEKIIDDKTGFEQTSNSEKHCKYCHFADFCQR